MSIWVELQGWVSQQRLHDVQRWPGHPAVRRVRAYRVRHVVVIGTATCPATSRSSASRGVTAGSPVCRRAAQWPPASRPDTWLAVRRWAADAEDAWADAERPAREAVGTMSLSGAGRSVVRRGPDDSSIRTWSHALLVDVAWRRRGARGRRDDHAHVRRRTDGGRRAGGGSGRRRGRRRGGCRRWPSRRRRSRPWWSYIRSPLVDGSATVAQHSGVAALDRSARGRGRSRSMPAPGPCASAARCGRHAPTTRRR